MDHLPLPIPFLPCAKDDGPDSILKHQPEKEFLDCLPQKIQDAILPIYDDGVFSNELLDLKLYSVLDPKNPSKTVDAGGNITSGTYGGTQVALTQLYSRIEQR